MATTSTPPGTSARGQRRRAALLEALAALLEERPLAEIQIDDIARRADITRSGFYFYFPTKAAAVAALMDDLIESFITVAVDWYERDDADHTGRVRAAMTAAVALWRENARLVAAMLDAAASDAEVAGIWEAFLTGLKATAADRIRRDRRLKLAPATIPAADLAAVLIDMTAYAMERDVRDGPLAHTTDALVHIWDRAVY